MSCLLHLSQRLPSQHYIKDDLLMNSLYSVKEIWRHDRQDGINLWPRARFIGVGDSTSDPNSPDIIQPPIAYDFWKYGWEDYLGSKYTLLYKIAGVTKDADGNPLGGCVVTLFRTVDDLKVDEIVSDAAGNYLLYTPYITEQHYCVAYKASAPDVTGATVNTLVGVA